MIECKAEAQGVFYELKCECQRCEWITSRVSREKPTIARLETIIAEQADQIRAEAEEKHKVDCEEYDKLLDNRDALARDVIDIRKKVRAVADWIVGQTCDSGSLYFRKDDLREQAERLTLAAVGEKKKPCPACTLELDGLSTTPKEHSCK